MPPCQTELRHKKTDPNARDIRSAVSINTSLICTVFRNILIFFTNNYNYDTLKIPGDQITNANYP